MITSDHQAVSHFGKKRTKPKHLSLPLPPSLPPPALPKPPPHFQTRKKRSYTLMNIRTGTNIHASCPDVQQKVHLQ